MNLMGFLIVTDKISDPKGGLPGATDPATRLRWGIGVRLYYCGEGPTMPTLDFAIGSAVEFPTREAADLRLMILWVWEPDLVEHGHVVEKETAWAQWHADLKDFEQRSGLDEPRERGGCF